MAKSVAILGRQPTLGLAELESLFGADKLHPLGTAAIIDVEPSQIPFARLGGTVKLCTLLDQLPFTDWQKITEYLTLHVPKHTCCFGPGKLTFGISTYGFKVHPKTINATALSIKKAVKATDRPVRVVPNKEPELSSAQVLHNRMTDFPLGMELVLIANGHQTVLAQTVAIQDIEAYAARDQKRPRRDARVGMLPPKLAQIIVNLATAGAPAGAVLDPFCGTGVILQEALLMGYRAYGTDLEPRMIDYSKVNLQWLKAPQDNWYLETGDATTHLWDPFPDFLAAETYLGRPFSALPNPETLVKVVRDVDTIHKKFLQNVTRQTTPGFRLCIAVPAWRTKALSPNPHPAPKPPMPASIRSGLPAVTPVTPDKPERIATQHGSLLASRAGLGTGPKSGFKHLPVLDSLRDLGYTRVNFVHAPWGKLVYHRPEQIVARELVVLERK